MTMNSKLFALYICLPLVFFVAAAPQTIAFAPCADLPSFRNFVADNFTTTPKNRQKANDNFLFTYGGRGFESAADIISVSSGGFLLSGRTVSGRGNTSMHLLRLNNQGQLLWEQKIGSDASDEAAKAIETEDGGFIIVGNSDSYGGGEGIKDMWAVKVDAEGNELWNKTYGTEESIDEARSIVPAHGGGFVIIGHSLTLEKETSDVMAVKINDNGEEEWQKTFGGEKSEEGTDIVKVENGYTIVGNTESKGKGKWDVWLLHIDKEGTQIWDNTFGGGDNEMANSLVQTTDGGYAIGGYTYSFAVASLDAWIVKADSLGKEEWAKAFGGPSTDEFYKIIQTKDNNLLAVGYTKVYVEDGDGNNVSKDGFNIFMVKINEEGDEMWQKSLGGAAEQRAFGVVETDSEDLVIAGIAKNEQNKSYDALVMKVSKTGS